MTPEADVQRAQSAQPQVQVVRTDGGSQGLGGLAHDDVGSSVVVMAPSMTSECPDTYFVAAWIDTSTPCSNGRKNSGLAQVLSRITVQWRACAAAAMPGTSCTSNVCEPGDSRNTTRVLSRISAAIPAPMQGS